MDNERSASHDVGEASRRSPARRLAEALVPKLAAGSVAIAALLAVLMQPPHTAVSASPDPVASVHAASADSPALPSGRHQP